MQYYNGYNNNLKNYTEKGNSDHHALCAYSSAQEPNCN